MPASRSLQRLSEIALAAAIVGIGSAGASLFFGGSAQTLLILLGIVPLMAWGSLIVGLQGFVGYVPALVFPVALVLVGVAVYAVHRFVVLPVLRVALSTALLGVYAWGQLLIFGQLY